MENMDPTRHAAPRDLMTSLWRTPPVVALTSPLIYSLIIPFALADLWVSLYQAICLPVYRIGQVRRRAYFKLDRSRLPYLNTIEKLNCLYCSYVNGVIAFVREVAARTEQYWCPIKHDEAPADPHELYEGFSRYGDATDFAVRREELRAELRTSPHTVTQAVRPAR